MKFELGNPEDNPKPVRLSLVKDDDGYVVLRANDRAVLMLTPDGYIYRFCSSDVQSLGFRTNADGRVIVND